MEVNRFNYNQVLPEILEKLRNAAFISFDAEYTGLKSDNGDLTSLFDNTAQRYEKLRRVVLNNFAPQFGIAIFQRNLDGAMSSQQLYTIDAYCFYLSEPCFADFNMTGAKAGVEIDCCQFLRGIKFNFEQWLKNAAPYLNNTRSKELEEYLSKNPNFMDKCEQDDRPLDKMLFPEKISVVTDKHKGDIIERLRGFSRIVDSITERKIPVVGHNMVLDLMYFFHQFCSDLPERYDDFKRQVLKFLPKLFDTKYMTVRCRKMLDHPSLKHAEKDIAKLKCSGLYVIYKTSYSKDKFSPKFVLSDTCQYFEHDLELGRTGELADIDSNTLCHQPSFDACVTGIVFLNIAYISCRMCKSFLSNCHPPSMEDVLFSISHWQNQIFIARATVMTMCLNGDDPRPNGSWLRITTPDKGEINAKAVMKRLKSEIERPLYGVDYRQSSPNEILVAVVRMESVTELMTKLQQLGYEVSKTLIPWDKKRYETVGYCKTDPIYDTGRNKYFS